MLVSCPSCDKQYKFPDEKLKAGGVKVKCKNCGEVFHVGGDDAAAAPRYTLHGPEGQTLGPFPLETVRARIEVGEVQPGWRIQTEGQDTAVAVEDAPELADVSWPAAPAAGGDDEFGFDDDFGGGPAAAGGDDFGFDDEPTAAGGSDADFGDLGDDGGLAPSGDDFGFGDEPAAPAAGGDDEDFDFGDAGDADAAAGEADFGDFDDDFGGGLDETPAPAAGGGDLDFGDDFGDDLGAPTAGGGDAGALDEDFAFDDFEDGGAAPADDWGDVAPGGDEGDLGADLFGDDAPAAGGGSDEDQLASLFEEEPPDAGADALAGGGDDLPRDELDESAFEFGDTADSGGEDVFYDEDFDSDFEAEVERQVEDGADDGSAAVGAFGEGDFDDAGLGGTDEELITTLEQLSKREAPRRVPVWVPILAVLAVLGGLAGLIFGAPAAARSIPGIGQLTLMIHEAMGSEFHRRQIIAEVWDEALVKLERWTPQEVNAALPAVQRVLQGDMGLVEAHEMGARARFFLDALAGGIKAQLSGLDAKQPVVAAYAYALGSGPEPAASLHAVERRLVVGWNAYRGGDVDGALAQLTGPTDGPMPAKLFVPVAAATIYRDLGQPLDELQYLQAAIEAHPNNPWVSLWYARSLWDYSPRPAEVLSVLDGVKAQFDQLIVAEQADAYELIARAYLEDRDLNAAMRAADQGLRVASQDSELLTVKGRVHLEKKDWADANLVLEQARRADEGNAEARIYQAHALAGIGKLAEAEALMRDTAQRFPNRPQVQITYIELLIQSNKLDEAEAAYSEAIGVMPAEANLVRIGADLALSRGDVVVARERLSDFQKAHPNDAIVMLKLAEIAMQRREYSSAEFQLRELLKRTPDSVPTMISLGEVLLAQGKAEEATEVLLDALGIDTKNPRLYTMLGQAFIEQGQLDEAWNMLGESQKIVPNSWMTLMHQGRVYLLQGKFSEATLTLEKAIENSNNAIEPRLWLAKVHEESGKPGRALDVYESILQNQPDHLLALRKVAEGQLAVDDWDEALAHIERWRELAPSEAEPYLYLGRVHIGKGELGEAVEVLRAGTRRFSRNAQLHSELGWAYLRGQRYGEAQTALEQAARLNPGDGRTQLRLGLLYKERNRTAEAKRALQKALRVGGMTEEERMQAELTLQELSY